MATLLCWVVNDMTQRTTNVSSAADWKALPGTGIVELEIRKDLRQDGRFQRGDFAYELESMINPLTCRQPEQCQCLVCIQEFWDATDQTN